MKLSACKGVDAKVCSFCGSKGNMKLTFNKEKVLIPVCHDWRECRKRMMQKIRSHTETRQ